MVFSLTFGNGWLLGKCPAISSGDEVILLGQITELLCSSTWSNL